MTVEASYTDGHGTDEVVSSGATAAVANVEDAPTGSPVVTGTTTEDQVLTADTSGIADADGLGASATSGSARAMAARAGATSAPDAATYTLGDADVGKRGPRDRELHRRLRHGGGVTSAERCDWQRE